MSSRARAKPAQSSRKPKRAPAAARLRAVPSTPPAAAWVNPVKDEASESAIAACVARPLDNAQPSTATAPEILIAAADQIDARATLRDQPNGERSMARTVAAYNALTGQSITEQQGWLFMVVLKAAQATAGGYNPDDFVDMAAYAALGGEVAAKQRA